MLDMPEYGNRESSIRACGDLVPFLKDPVLFDSVKSALASADWAKGSGHAPIRIWVPGCSTGEEVYTLAIVLSESTVFSGGSGDFMLIGTDINDGHIRKARRGVYDRARLVNLPEDLISRYFEESGHGTKKVSAGLRERCIFGSHNLFVDVPFSENHLIDISNLRFEYDPGMLKRVIEKIDHSLIPGGLLVIGGRGEPPGPGSSFSAADDRGYVYEYSGGGPQSPGFRRILPERENRADRSALVEDLLISNEQLISSRREAERARLEKTRISRNLEDILDVLDSALVVLGPDFLVERFNTRGSSMFNLIEDDIGRSILDLRPNVEVPDLEAILGMAADSGDIQEKEVRDSEGGWHLMKVEPVRGERARIARYVLMCTNIDFIRRARERLEFHSDVLSRVNDAIVAVDGDDRVTYMNAEAERRYGMTEMEALGRKLEEVYSYEFLSEEDRENALRALAEHGRWKGENIHITRSGDRHHVESSVSVVRDAHGNAAGMQAVIRDVTERNRLAKSLSEKEELLDAALDSGRMFAFEWDPETDEFVRTEQCVEILGIGEDEIDTTANEYFRTIHPEDIDGFLYLIMGLTPDASTYSISYRVRRKDTGAYVVIGEKGQAHFGPGGKIVKVAGMVADITLRKSLERELTAQKELYERIIDLIPVMIVMYDPEMKRFTFNSEVSRVLGWTEEDVTDGKFMEKAYPDPDYRRSVEEYMASLEPGFRDLEVIAKDGTVIESSWANIRLSDDRQVGIGIDIRKRKEAERILERDREELEELVREKTFELMKAREEIERARRLADIGELAAVVAHELRNPLAAIGMSAYNLRRKTDDRKVAGHLDKIETKIEESNRIIEDLLFFSRLRMPEHKEFRIHDLLVDVVDEACRNTGLGKSVFVLETETVRDLMINADPLQIRQVLVNLVNNACESLDRVKGRIVISASAEEGEVSFEIMDNGPGIKEEHLERIFDPFFTTKIRGTGLGLPICRQIIVNHEGKIGLTSRRGGADSGTTVTVSLPVGHDRQSELNDAED